MKKFSFFIFGILLASSAFSQSIKSYVITSAGTAFMDSGGAIYLSIGEPMNTEIEGGEIMISQGFLNVTIAGSVVDTDDLLDEVIKAYPNPVGNQITIEMPEMDGNYFYELYDLSGRLLEKESLTSTKEGVDFTDKDSGSYHLRVVKDNQSSKTLKIIKI